MPAAMNTKTAAVVLVATLAMAGAGAGIFLLTKSAPEGYSVDTELQIFGNANGDWKLDGDDVDFLNSIISGSSDRTTYADANQDGVVDASDVE